MKTIFALTAAAVLLAGHANAEPEAQTFKTSVNYGDLDLGHTSGQAMLDRRIKAAAAVVCPTAAGPPSLREQRAARECRRSAITAVQPQVAALHTAPRTPAVASAAPAPD